MLSKYNPITFISGPTGLVWRPDSYRDSQRNTKITNGIFVESPPDSGRDRWVFWFYRPWAYWAKPKYGRGNRLSQAKCL